MADFAGKYNLDHNENFMEYLEANGQWHRIIL